MATVRQLERQIRELRKQLEASNRQLRQTREQINRINTDRYDDLNRRYQNLLAQKVRQNEQEYERQLNRLRDEMAALDRSRMQEIHRILEQARREQARLLKKLEEKNRELQDIIRRVQEREQERTQISSDSANTVILSAKETAGRASLFPHEFFFPNQFAVIQEHLDSASRLAGKQMYEAASATAEAARAEIELLIIKTRQKMDEWEELFTLYCESVRRLKKRLDDLSNIRLTTAAGTFTMNSAEIDFWSRGIFSDLQTQIMEAWRTIEEIEAAGIAEYLKKQSPMTMFMLNRTLNETEQMEFRMEAVDRCVRSERRMSDERYMIGQRIISVLEHYGYIPEEETGFLQKEEGEDPKDRYEILYCEREMDDLCISLVPVRSDGICRGVRCFVKWTIRSAPDPEVIRQISNVIHDRITRAIRNLSVQIVMNMPDGQFETMVGRISQTPNPDILYEVLRR